MAAAAPTTKPPLFKIGIHGEQYADYHMMTDTEWNAPNMHLQLLVANKNGIPLFDNVECDDNQLYIENGIITIDNEHLYCVKKPENQDPGNHKCNIKVGINKIDVSNPIKSSTLRKVWGIKSSNPNNGNHINRRCIYVSKLETNKQNTAIVNGKLRDPLSLTVRSSGLYNHRGAQRSRRRKQSKRARKQKKRTRKH